MVMMLMMMTSGCLIGVSFGWNAFKVGKIDILIPSSSTLVVLAALDAPGLVIVNSSSLMTWINVHLCIHPIPSDPSIRPSDI